MHALSSLVCPVLQVFGDIARDGTLEEQIEQEVEGMFGVLMSVRWTKRWKFNGRHSTACERAPVEEDLATYIAEVHRACDREAQRFGE